MATKVQRAKLILDNVFNRDLTNPQVRKVLDTFESETPADELLEPIGEDPEAERIPLTGLARYAVLSKYFIRWIRGNVRNRYQANSVEKVVKTARETARTELDNLEVVEEELQVQAAASTKSRRKPKNG